MLEASDVKLDYLSASKIVKKYREGVGRYEYTKICHSHFEIKHWSVVSHAQIVIHRVTVCNFTSHIIQFV